MNKTPLISIIIPIYNVEKYILGTLNSIYNQRFDEQEFEVICVNDGTPDKSMQIVKEFDLTHPNIHIINQENQGLSCARNHGLRHAKGEYVWFVDSDDTIDNKSLITLQKVIFSNQDIDILAFDMIWIDEKTGSEYLKKIIPKKKHDFLYRQKSQYNQIVGKFTTTPAQQYVFKRKFLLEKSLSFCHGIYHEDEEFVPKAIFSAETIQFMDISLYRYLVRSSGSITSQKNIKRTTDKLKILERLTKYKKEYAKSKSEKSYFDFYIYMLVFSILYDNRYSDKRISTIINDKKTILRKLIVKGIYSSVYYRLWKQVLKGGLVLLIPSLGAPIVAFCKRLHKSKQLVKHE